MYWQVDSGCTRIAIAGTMCTPWSAIGKRDRWASFTCFSFIIWCFQVLGLGPEYIIHECTPQFDISVLQVVFGERYHIQSFVFGPTDVGVPEKRKRRWTLMSLKRAVNFSVGFDAGGFGNIFFQHCATTGHVFFCAAESDIDDENAIMASKRDLPARQPSGERWPERQLLAAGNHGRLMMYEILIRRRRLPPKYIVNIAQTAAVAGDTYSEFVPSLLTATSLLWDQTQERTMLAKEHLGVQGVPFLSTDIELTSHFPVIRTMQRGQLKDSQVRHLAGNGMQVKCIGSVLMFALSCSRKIDSCAAPALLRDRMDDADSDSDL